MTEQEPKTLDELIVHRIDGQVVMMESSRTGEGPGQHMRAIQALTGVLREGKKRGLLTTQPEVLASQLETILNRIPGGVVDIPEGVRSADERIRETVDFLRE